MRAIRRYADQDIQRPYKTGRNSRRKNCNSDCGYKRRRIKAVVVHRLDRLYRNLESQLEFGACARIIMFSSSVSPTIDPEPGGALVLYVLGAMAEMYVRQTTSARVKRNPNASAATTQRENSARLLQWTLFDVQ